LPEIERIIQGKLQEVNKKLENEFSTIRFHVESERENSKEFVNRTLEKVKDMMVKSEKKNLNFKKAI